MLARALHDVKDWSDRRRSAAAMVGLNRVLPRSHIALSFCHALPIVQ